MSVAPADSVDGDVDACVAGVECHRYAIGRVAAPLCGGAVTGLSDSGVRIPKNALMARDPRSVRLPIIPGLSHAKPHEPIAGTCITTTGAV